MELKITTQRNELAKLLATCFRKTNSIEDLADALIANGITTPKSDSLNLPCKIGDRVYAVRNYKSKPVAQEGIVSDMFFTSDMRLCIVVRGICRGCWGETIFADKESAEKSIKERTKI